MTVRQLSERLTELGSPLLPSGITKIEQGQRRVDVEDFLALAAALNVSPARLLLPDVGRDDEVAVTPALRRPAWAVWRWIEGGHSLPSENDGPDQEADLDLLDVRPVWKRLEEDHPLSLAVRRLASTATGILRVKQWSPERQAPGATGRWVESARADLRRVEDELRQIELEEERG